MVYSRTLQITPTPAGSEHRKFVDTFGRPLFTDWKKHVLKVSNPFKDDEACQNYITTNQNMIKIWCLSDESYFLGELSSKVTILGTN